MNLLKSRSTPMVAPGGVALEWRVEIYDSATGTEIAALANHTAWVASLAFSRTDPILATSSADQRIRVWDTRTWKETCHSRVT